MLATLPDDVALCALTLVVVASALYRMHVYQDAYGFTRLRLLVDVFEGWLGVLVLATMVGGAADLSESNLTDVKGAGEFQADDPGRNIRFGVREHAMGGAANGIRGY